jgi:hypothetical protein
MTIHTRLRVGLDNSTGTHNKSHRSSATNKRTARKPPSRLKPIEFPLRQRNEITAITVRAALNEISFQPTQAIMVMTTRTKMLAVNNSRPEYAVGGKSRPSSDSRDAPARDWDAISARSARLCVGHGFVRQIVATDPLHYSVNQRLL